MTVIPFPRPNTRKTSDRVPTFDRPLKLMTERALTFAIRRRREAERNFALDASETRWQELRSAVIAVHRLQEAM